MLGAGYINKYFLEVFHSMDEGVKYQLKKGAMDELNELRQSSGFQILTPFSFTKFGWGLHFDWQDNDWEDSVVTISPLEKSSSILVLLFDLLSDYDHSLPGVGLAIAEGRIEKAPPSDASDKILRIAGKRYKLVEV